MTASLHLRPVGPFDLQLLAALHAGCFTADWDQAWSADSFANLLAMPGAAGLLLSTAAPPEPGRQEAEQGSGEPLGFVLTRSVLDEMEIILLAIRPDHRGQGLGRSLAESVIDQAAKASMRTLFLEYAAPNLAAGRLYRRVGFEQVGLRRNYYRGARGSAADAVTMRLELEVD
ncbi:MAG: GNAT family N-acetyltransferase [Dongiaceae bacterium]